MAIKIITMAQNKSYTDLSQSKKLAEILPLKSADMWWAERYAGRVENYEFIVEENPFYYLSFTKPSEENYSQDTIKDIPCWSLTALLSVIPKRIKDYNVLRIDISVNDFAIWYDEIGYGVNDELPDITKESAVDACYEMIIKLHELKHL